MSGKIERVAPKGKIQKNETPQQAAIREVSEEV
jgi:8-oxo-dGTP pyrophosphatase MutT (NUDIX family)